MASKVLGPSERVSGNTSPSGSASSRVSSPKSAKASAKLSSEGVSPKAKASPEKAKAKGEAKKSAEKAKPKSRSGKTKKDGKEQEDFATLIPPGTAFAALGCLRDVAENVDAQLELMVEKLELCCELFDFAKDDRMPEKDGKRFTLLEILAHWPGGEKPEKEDLTKPTKKSSRIQSSDEACNSATLVSSCGTESSELSGRHSSQLFNSAVKMIRANAFRTQLHKDRTPMDLLDGDDDEPLLEPTWPHLELVYELLLKIVQTKDLDIAALQGAGFDKGFVTVLVDLMESDDPREREMLKNILLKIFSKLSNFRSTVRRGIQSFCQRAVTLEVTEAPQCGLCELLEIFGQRIVGSFNTPLRKEHRDVLSEVLLPLYKLDFLSFFYSQLKEVVRSFCKKEPALTKAVASALLRYWPQCASSKQTIFLGELEDMIHQMPTQEFKSIAVKVSQRLAQCCTSPHSEVAEKALGIWRHQQTVRQTVQHSREEMPMVLSNLYTNVTQAWGQNVMSKTLDVLKNFMEADKELFDSCSSKHRKQADEAEKKDSQRRDRWAMLQAMHDRSRPAALARPTRTEVKSSSGRQQLPTNEEVMLKPDCSCAVALCWDWASEPKKEQLVLQAFMVNTDGKIVDSVHHQNVTAFQSAVRLTARAPAQNSRDTCSGTIWASLDLLPVDVAMVIYVVTSSMGSSLGSLAQSLALVVDMNGNVSLGEACAEVTSEAKLCCLGMLKRLDWSSWSWVTKTEWSKYRHFMDHQDLAGKVVKEVLPLVPKKQRGQTSYVAMAKGSVADCPALPATLPGSRVFMGLGWDFYTEATTRIDVAIVLFAADGTHIATVSKGGDSVNGSFHTGEGALSSGVFMELDSLPREVSMAFLVGHIESEDFNFSMVQQPHCTVIDSGGKEILRYFMQEDKKNSGTNRGLIMARLFWNQFHERWSCQALGIYHQSRCWPDSVEEMQRLVSMAPSSFQTLLLEDEDSVTRGDHRSTTAASSTATSVVMSL